MKKVLSILTLATALFAVQVHAQVLANAHGNSVINVLGGVTSNLPPSLCVIDCSASRNVAVKWTLQLGGAGTEVSGLRFIPSVDGTIPSVPALGTGFYIANAANGTTAVTVQTNFDTLGYRYLVGYYITNGTAGSVLTNTIDYLVVKNTGK